jgi:thiol-disulfide isomerase/thioredoxin
MKIRTILFLAALAVAIVVGFVFTTSLKPAENGANAITSLASESSLPVVSREGKKVNLAKVRGKVVLVHFWATWCPPCVEEIPELDKFWAHFKGNPKIELYSVSVDDTWEAIDEFRKKTPFELPLYRDPESSTAHKFGTSKFPETYIANGEGRILYHLAQAIDWDSPEVMQNVQALLAKE